MSKIVASRPFLRYALAASLHHREELEILHPDNGIVRSSPLYTSALINQLKQHVETFLRVAMPWDNDAGTAYFEKVTGIPPHVLLLAGQKSIEELIKTIVPSME